MNYHYLSNWKSYLLVALLFIVPNLGAEQIPETNTSDFTNWSQGISTRLIGQDEVIFDTLITYGGDKSAYALPPGWDAPVNTGKSTGVIIALEADPKINDVSINLGDAIGAFFINDDGEMQCSGVTYWPDTNGIVMTVFGDNTATPEKDGFSNGEYMNYKIFSWEYNAEFDVDAIELDPDFFPNNVWIKLAIPRLLEMTCFEDLWVKATADNDSLCNGAPVSFDIEIIEGTGNITYNWSSIPPGFSSTLPNPVFNLSETTLFSVEANDGINQFTALKEIFVANNPVVFAGENLATCGVEILNLTGSADFVSNIYWTSSGDGTFSDFTSLNPDYYLGPDDFQSDEILFNLIGQPVSPCQNQTSDEMVVSIYPTPIINLPESFSTCKYQPVLLVAEGANLSDVLWETEGNGTFSHPDSLITYYTHGSYGSSHSSVTLTLTGHGIDPCDFTIIEQIELYINKNAFCSSGPDATICSNQTFETCGGAAYANSIIWTTDGDGTFEDNTLLKSIYHPGPEDISNGSVDLTIHVTSAPPCTAAPYSEMTLTIYDGPTVDAGSDIGACGNPVVPLNASAEMYSSVEWSTSGNGNFEEINELSTIYTASPEDMSYGTVLLTIQALAIDPCSEASFDELTVNFEGGTTASAGPDMTVCHNESAFIQGWAINYQDLLWTTSGDGEFNEPNSPVTLYTPGPDDIMNGEVTLSIHPEGIPPCTGGMIDEMILSIVSPATLSVTNTEIEVCENDNAYLNANATNFSYILWTSSGDGVFDNKHSLSPAYTPGSQDIQTGYASLEISITSIQPCTDILNEVVELSIYKEPVAYAGNNGSVCIGSNYTVNGTIFNGDESEWMTSGDGYFENPFATGTIYHPGNNDLQQASVTLTLKALPVVPCEVSHQDELILYIFANPTCNAGNNKIICEGSSLDLSGSASNYQSIYWETAGDGSFSDINDLNSTYFPGQADIGIELVTITLTAVAQSPCSILAQDNMDITIESSATANAGADITICETDVANITGVAQGYQAVSWNSDGDGTFENPSTLSTIYEPGPNDLINRDIELCLTVYGTALCGSVSSCINVHLEHIPVVNAGEDNTSPVNTPYYTEGSEAYYHSSVLWTTSGTGTFSNPGFISNHYTPSQSDLNNSPVNLTLTAQPENACVTVVSDSFILNVIPDCVDANAYAGTDATLCVSQYNVLMLSDAQAENAETVFWSTNGDGVFTNNTLLQPTYIAGAGDKQNGTVELCLTAKAYGTCVNDVDCLTLTLNQPPTANAGIDQSICEGDFVNLTGQANYAANTLWTSEGDGSFENNLSQETKYFPGAADIENGSVELCIEAFGIGDCGNTSSCVSISIIKLPNVEAGDDQIICQESLVILAAESENTSSHLWESNGDGTFADNESPNTTYFPGENDIQSGNFELCIQAEGSSNCGTASDCMNVNIQNPPLAGAGANQTICEGESIQLSGFAENYDQLLWEASGDGTFNNNSTLTPTYYPGSGDAETGYVEICLTASGLSECESINSCMVLDIIRIPVVEAGNNKTVCENQAVVLDGISSFTTSTMWSTSGDGTFDNPELLNAIYTPGSEDISFGNIQLCLSGDGTGDCQDASDCLLISVVPNPMAIAGSDITICEGDIVNLYGYAEYNTGTLWQSSGTGTFGNPELLQTTYTPCAQGIVDGYVQLCLSAFGNEGCTTDESCINVTIQKLPFVYIGEDMTVCSNSTIELNGEVDFIDGLQWSTNGSGTFSNPENINTTYYPSPQDVQLGFVEVCIEAFGIGACENQQICKIISFEDAPTANAGTDLTICEGQTASLNGIADNYNAIFWTSQGDGTFDNTTVADANYFPGPSDIAAGQVSICMEAIGAANCDNTSDCLNLKIQRTPEVYAGEDLTFYTQQPLTTDSAYALNSSSVYWETSGSGTFDTINNIISTYTPSLGDYQNLVPITLSLSAYPETPCTVTKSDDFVVEYFIDCFNAIANAGEDASVCGGADYQLNGEALEYSSAIWASSGTGTFDDASALDATYTPSEDDILSGQVNLCLTAFANGECEDATDCMSLTFVQPVIASAGSDNTAPYLEPYTFPDAYAQNASLIQWSLTGGIGELINDNTIHPTYYPNYWDTFYEIQFNLVAYSNTPCEVAVYDALMLTFTEACADALANAGEDITMCEGNIVSEVSLENAFASNFKSLLWSTSGDGTFNFSNIINPVYTLGSNDLSGGNVELSLFAEGFDVCNNASDQLIIQTSPAPTANAGNDFTVCGIAGVPLFGSASGYTNLEWTTNGDGAFIDASGLNPIYYPGSDDLENGSVELCLLVSGSGDCPMVSDCMGLTIIPVATVNAGNDDAICVGESYPLNAAASDYSAILWNTNGDGTFSNDQILNPVYTPGNGDVEADSAILMLTAFGMGECADITGTLVLSIVAEPIAFAGEDANIDMGESYYLQDAVAENVSSILWESSGSGSFENDNSINTTYFSVEEDFPEVILTLMAMPLEPCMVSSSDEINITIDEGCQDAVADAGEDIYSCEQDGVQLSGSAQNEIAVLWTSDGDGTFDNAANLLASYYPGANDLSTGMVEIHFTAFADEDCNNNTDDMNIMFFEPATVDAGEDIFTCDSETAVPLNGSASNFSSLQWTSTGSGAFMSPNSLNAFYILSPGDKVLGEIYLILTAYNDDCGSVSDSLKLTINSAPFIFINQGATICGNEQFVTDGYAINYSTLYWSSQGDGTFENSNQIVATYFPGSQDIQNGSVQLCLTAIAFEGCADLTECLTLTLNPSAFANAGVYQPICEDESLQLSGQAEDNETVLWESFGDGTFDNPNMLNAIYFPGSIDIANKQFSLQLTAYSSTSCGDAISQTTVSILDNPMVNAGPDQVICENGFAQLSGLTENTTGLLWESDGDGSFDDNTSASATYYPGEADIANGTVNLCFTAFADGSCQDAQDCMVVNFDYAPSANAGLDDVICETESYQLNGAAENFTSVLWETNGDGTFDNPASLTSVYYPGVDDVETGFAELVLSAYAEALCEEAIDDMILTIEKSPEVNAGSDLNICETGFAQLSGLTENNNESLWETDGDGTFDVNTSAAANYYPGEGDIANGSVNLCLTAFADGSCQDAQDCMVVNFEYAPSANAGLDDVICETESYQLNGAAENFASVHWETNGDGTFDDPSNLNSVYYPGVDDIETGFAELVLSAYADALCEEAIDNMILSIDRSPEVNAGSDLNICESGFAQLNGLTENTTGLLWETDGDGSFDDNTSASATYYPGEGDIANGEVELCLFATGSESCSIISDCLMLSFQQQAEVILPESFTVCESDNIEITAVADNYSSLIWTSDGDGTFDFNDQLTVIYSPGTADIQNESVNLCLSALGISGCEAVNSCVTFGIQSLPEVMAGNDQTICENEIIELTADATDYDAIIWSTSGDGTFSDPEMLIGSYQPGPLDISSGFVELCISATGINVCSTLEDCMEVTIKTAPTANAGNDQTICQSQNVPLIGSVSNATSHLWETTGDGTFGNASNLNTTYYPGEQDNLTMSVQLCLSSTGSNYCEAVYDCINVAIMPGAAAYAGTDISICKGESVFLTGTVSGNSGLMWTTSGNGNFNNPQLLNPYYMPSTADIENGSVTLCLYAFSANGCGSVNDCLTVTINKEPIVDAGEDLSVCESEFATLNGVGQNYASMYWTTNGDGTFEDEQNPLTNYYPGLNDLETGLVDLCLVADGLSPCAGSSDCTTLHIYKNPSVSFDDMEVCLAESIPVFAGAQNYQTATWQTSGDGTFENAGMINTSYYPGEQDIANMLTEICLTLTGNSGCGEITECMAISFTALPTAYAGINDSVSIGAAFDLSEAIANNYSSVFWTTTGAGTLEDSSSVNATYYPAIQDLQVESIELMLHVVGNQPCNDTISDTIHLKVYTNDCVDVEVYAGEDQTICENGSFTPIAATSYFETDLLWTTTGDGTFDDPNELYTIYTPGESDIAIGHVSLKIKGFAQEPCIDDSDVMELTIQHSVMASAGSDNTAPFFEAYTFPDAFAQNASLIQWSLTNGIGELINENSIHPTYYPNIFDTFNPVQFNLAATSNSPCTVAVYDVLMLTFTQECADAIADAGENISICANDSVIQLQAYAANFSGLFWTTAGDGTFTFGNSASPKYTLGSIDQISDEVMLYFHVESFGDCSSAIDSVLVSPLIMPQVDAGPNQTICEAGVVVTDQTNVLNASSVEWSTSGDGTFSDVNSVVTQYTPGEQDIADRTLLLSISALSLQPCQVTISKSFQLTIDKKPEVLIELEDIEATIGEDVPLIVISKYAKEYQWYGPDGIINGETLPVLLLWEVDFDDAGYYYCELTNDCGITTSNEAKVSVYEQQSISIPAGWSGISSYITPGNSLLEDIFSDYIDDLVMLKNFSGIYNPGIGVNTLVNWNKMAGYEVNFDQAVEFKMSGVINENRTITINVGWNIIPVISNCPVNIDSLFDGHNGKVDIIKEIAGYGVYWPAIGINTIGYFMPGKAYCMRANETFEVTFKPCESTKSSYISNLSCPINQTPWNDMHLSLATHTIAIDQLLLDELNIGDVIGAFTSSGRCAGYLEIKAEDNVLVLFGDDPISADVDGFVENEPIHFRIYNTATGEEVDFYPEFSNAYPQNDGVFVNNGMSRLIKASVNGIGNDGSTASNISIYPNPTFGKIMISGLTEGSTIEICNSEGQLLREINFNTTDEHKLLDVDLSDFSSGMVYVRIFNHDQVIIKKIVLR